MKRIIFGLTILLTQFIHALSFTHYTNPAWVLFITPILSVSIVIAFIVRNDIHNRVEEPFPGIRLITAGSVLVTITWLALSATVLTAVLAFSESLQLLLIALLAISVKFGGYIKAITFIGNSLLFIGAFRFLTSTSPRDYGWEMT